MLTKQEKLEQKKRKTRRKKQIREEAQRYRDRAAVRKLTPTLNLQENLKTLHLAASTLINKAAEKVAQEDLNNCNDMLKYQQVFKGLQELLVQQAEFIIKVQEKGVLTLNPVEQMRLLGNIKEDFAGLDDKQLVSEIEETLKRLKDEEKVDDGYK